MASLSVLRYGRALIPKAIRPTVKRLLLATPLDFKHESELQYWRDQQRLGLFDNSHYRDQMLAMAEAKDESFIADKIVADFGCGPQGSLCWATSARSRIGIDVLSDAYTEFGIRDHDMTYVASTEASIPLPSNYVDVLFTLNAMDHVNQFDRICDEIVRIMAPGGRFIGSFNLSEPPTFSEPQTLTERLIKDRLLSQLEVISYRTAAHAKPGDVSAYQNFYDNNVNSGRADYLWVSAKKPKARQIA